MSSRIHARPAEPMANQPSVEPPKVEWTPNGKKKRAATQSTQPRPIRWPATREARRDMLDTWFLVAAQIAETKTDFAVLLALRRWIDIRDGTATATNEMLARWAGHPSTTHVSRSISWFSKAGLCTVEIAYRTDDEAGKQRRTRTMRLAFPSEFPAGVTISQEANHLADGVQATPPKNSPESPNLSCARGAQLAHGVQDYEGPSPDRSQKKGTNGYARAKAIDAEPGDDLGPAASEVADHTLNAEHDDTARRPSGRAFVESPSIDLTESEV